MKTKQTIYIAGPMSGLPNFNHAAFFDAEFKITEQNEGIEIINPARNEVSISNEMTDSDIWEAYMEISREQVKRADAVVVLDGWNHSRGAREEVWLAIDRGIPLYVLSDLINDDC